MHLAFLNALWWQFYRLVENVLENLVLRFTVEREVARHKLISDDAQGPEIHQR